MAAIDGTYVAFETINADSPYTPYRTHPISGNYVDPGGSGTTTYTHRAWNSDISAHVTWSHTAEDPTGASSGYNPAFLSDIVLLSVA